ncbi:MAG: DNA repair protein RecN [Acidaminococcaceae bacterium]|nr:DNA repair protein RecN [Acidaminococcaceae bacterium]
MLQSLHVHNFALIEDAEVEFSDGFNIFTGETGAGKSILIDAFSIVLGGRASSDFVRSGTDAFWVQAVFSSSDTRISELLREQGIEKEDSLFLKRRVTAAGKSQSSINGIQVPLSVLKRFASLLADIHGQHENQMLLHPSAPRIFTDAFGGADGQHTVARYGDAFRRYVSAKEKLHSLEEQGNQRERLMDRLSWEVQEIGDAGIRIGEEAALKEEAKLLQNSGKIMDALNRAYAGLDEENGALTRLAEIREQIGQALRYDPNLQSAYEGIDSAWIAADDACSQIQEYVESRNYDQGRMTEVQERLDMLYRLQRKYGNGEEAVLEYLEKAKEQYALLQDLDNRINAAQKELTAITGELGRAADALTALRKKNGKKLCAEVEKHIRDLAMPDGTFSIVFTETKDFTADGKDQMEFLFSANAGEPPQPLSKVASGGELSRMALALKTVLTGVNSVDTMVFDEIDTGVGGVTAQKMAEKLALISKEGQVLCITHLAQIAAFADRHIRILKETEGGRTSTRLSVLDHDGKIQELVRMTAGEHMTKAAVANAEVLLDAAEAFKKARGIIGGCK